MFVADRENKLLVFRVKQCVTLVLLLTHVRAAMVYISPNQNKNQLHKPWSSPNCSQRAKTKRRTIALLDSMGPGRLSQCELWGLVG